MACRAAMLLPPSVRTASRSSLAPLTLPRQVCYHRIPHHLPVHLISRLTAPFIFLHLRPVFVFIFFVDVLSSSAHATSPHRSCSSLPFSSCLPLSLSSSLHLFHDALRLRFHAACTAIPLHLSFLPLVRTYIHTPIHPSLSRTAPRAVLSCPSFPPLTPFLSSRHPFVFPFPFRPLIAASLPPPVILPVFISAPSLPSHLFSAAILNARTSSPRPTTPPLRLRPPIPSCTAPSPIHSLLYLYLFHPSSSLPPSPSCPSKTAIGVDGVPHCRGEADEVLAAGIGLGLGELGSGLASVVKPKAKGARGGGMPGLKGVVGRAARSSAKGLGGAGMARDGGAGVAGGAKMGVRSAGKRRRRAEAATLGGEVDEDADGEEGG
ncbi:hypothetical protein C8J57DRAFT_1513379 [Mycena rebaudengoi]|nr:hypothetical protein C8J57DRAFT_1513379 [Mycena rebaudengoi]